MAEAAKRLNVPNSTVEHHVRTNRIRHVRVPNPIRIPQSDWIRIPQSELEKFYVLEKTHLLELLRLVHQKIFELYHRSEFDAMFLLLESCGLLIELVTVFKSTKTFSTHSVFLIQRNLDVFKSRHSPLWDPNLADVVKILKESDYCV